MRVCDVCKSGPVQEPKGDAPALCALHEERYRAAMALARWLFVARPLVNNVNWDDWKVRLGARRE